MTVLALIDLGSNSVRLMVNRIHDDGTYEVLDRRQETVRLSAGMGDQKILQPDAIERTLEALKGFKKICDSIDEQVTIRAVATAAVRQAKNQDEFLKRFEEVMALPLEIITGAQEATFDFIGVANSLSTENALILDTGGASTEIVLMLQNKLIQRISLPVGSVNITEGYLEKDIVSAKSLFNATLLLQDLFHDLPWLNQAKHLPVIAIGGSNRTLAKISRRRGNKLDLPIHGYHMSRQEVSDTFAELLGKNKAERIDVRGVAKTRGDIIIGGLLPLVLILEKIDSSQVIFSQSGIREGLLFSAIEEHTNAPVIMPEADQLTIDQD